MKKKTVLGLGKMKLAKQVRKLLIFGMGNSKLSRRIATFSLPAGHTCPFAKICKTAANRETGKLTIGKHCTVRCFSASQENAYPSVRKARWDNLELLRATKSIEEMSKLIHDSLPQDITEIRIHVSGDYYSQTYFLAWLNVAYNNPDKIFYGYTKATPFLAKYKKLIPKNFRFTASKGGTCDSLIKTHKMKWAEIVFSVKEAEEKGLEIDHTDSLAIANNSNFALLLHGTQNPGSAASKAWVALRKQGIGGYGTSSISRHVTIKPVWHNVITFNNGKVKFVPQPKKAVLA